MVFQSQSVNVYVVVYFCDGVWSFKANLSMFFLLLFVYICVAVGYPIIIGGDPINRFNHDPFLCLFQARTGILLMQDHNMLTEKLQQEN